MKNSSENDADKWAADQVRWTMERIEGYLQLGMTKKARKLFDTLPDSAAGVGRIEFIALQLELASREEQWSEVARLSEQLYALLPENPNCVVQWAYATRRSEGIKRARTILENGLKHFPKVATIHYNLGCYACVENDLEKAKVHLRQAFELDEEYVEMGMDDEDLVNLRDFISDAQKE